MDGKFLDVYNEVILENFYAVLKQNFMFQTQLKFAEENNKKIADLEKQIAVLTSENKDTVTQKNQIIENSVNIDNERHRLQVAVNNQMKELESLKKIIENLNEKEKDQQKYIVQLENMFPNSKKKKLGIGTHKDSKLIKEETTTLNKDNDNTLKFASSGGTF